MKKKVQNFSHVCFSFHWGVVLFEQEPPAIGCEILAHNINLFHDNTLAFDHLQIGTFHDL